MSDRESKILADVRIAIGSRRDIFAWRCNTGVFAPLHGKKNRVIRSAPNGTPDIIGSQLQHLVATDIVQPNSFQPLERKYHYVYGQAFAIETKTLRGKQRPEQIAWQKAFEASGGLYILARDVEDVIAALGEDDPQFDAARVLNSHRMPVK